MAQDGTTRGASRLFTPDEGGYSEYPPGTVYRCEVYLSHENGVFHAATALPDISGRGGSEAEALEDAQKAAGVAIRRYKEICQDIPWKRREIRVGEVARVITIQV